MLHAVEEPVEQETQIVPVLVYVSVTAEKVRNLINKNSNVVRATTGEAKAFLVLHGKQLQEYLDAAVTVFVNKKMGGIA